MAAPLQVPAWQTVPAAYLRQAPAPSQVPSSPQAETSPLGQSSAVRGAAPAGTIVHVPGAPGARHVWQGPAQPALQQTPSAQKPL
jgi:hypothetical protein